MSYIPFYLKYTSHYDEIGGTRQLIARVDKCAQGLRDHCDQLPRVDRDGQSPCPFASALYQDAADWREAFVGQLEQLREHCGAATRAMEEEEHRERECLRDDDESRPIDAWKHHRVAYEEHRRRRAAIREKTRAAEQALAATDAIVAERRAS